MKSKMGLCVILLVMFILSGCGKESQERLVPLLGLEWFASVDDVKGKVESLSLIQERAKDAENSGNQLYIDYADAELMDVKCDITFDFSDDGLIGLNYHDIEKTKNFREWNEALQQIYGVPTEQGNGMASWYKNPVGKNTALYLFNLQEGVQISFYSTSSTPDKSYSGKKKTEDNHIPVPEMRTPIIPVEEPESVLTTVVTSIDVNTSITTDYVDSYEDEDYDSNVYDTIIDDIPLAMVTDLITTTIQTEITTTTVSVVSNGEQTTVVTTLDVKNQDAYKQNELEFYISPETAQNRLKSYKIADDYMLEDEGEAWEQVVEYDDVEYCEKNVMLYYVLLVLD